MKDDFFSNEKFLASGTENGDVFVWCLDTYKLLSKLTGIYAIFSLNRVECETNTLRI